MKLKHVILFIVFGLLAEYSFGQTKVQVVTITKTESFDWTESTTLVVNGERAEIQVLTHQLPTIECEVKLISKHPDGSVAKREIEYHQWVVDRIGKKILLRNFIEVPSGVKKPEGNLKAIYTIKVPKRLQLEINNYFGKIEISGTQNGLKIKNDYSKVFLTNIQGPVNIETKFGDIIGEQLNGDVTIISNRGDITLTNIKGRFDLNVSGAAVSILQQANVEEFILNAKKSDILFDISNMKEYNLELDTEQAEIKHPAWMVFKDFEEKGGKKTYKLKKSEHAGNISVSLQYGKLEFQEHSGSH